MVTYDRVTGGTEGANGWYTSPVTVQFSATDALSGIAGDETRTARTSEEGDDVVVGSPVFSDLAGNTALAHSAPLKIDTEAPNAPTYTLSSPSNTAGWSNHDVVVTFYPAGDHGPSEVAYCSSSVTVSADGTHAVTGYCWDNAGNQSQATTVTVNIDKTAPTDIQFGQTTLTDGGSYYYGSVPAVPSTCSATDEVSGVATCVVTGGENPGATGGHTLTATATNWAGLQTRSSFTTR